jgi:hypothetical protein
MSSPDRPWWMPLELLERNRFRVLQRLYDLVGGATDEPLKVDAAAIAATLGISEADVAQAVAFLIHAHYASEAEAAGEVCVTRRAVYYLEAGAYQRRTIRD